MRRLKLARVVKCQIEKKRNVKGNGRSVLEVI
jgi:hypothetical protein